VLLPREVRRKLARLGNKAKQPGEKGQRPADQAPLRSADGPPRRAPQEESPRRSLARPVRERLKRRVAGLGKGEQVRPSRGWAERLGAGEVVPLEVGLPGEVVSNELGTLYVVRRREVEVSQHPSPLPRFLGMLARADLAQVHEEFAPLSSVEPEDIAFLDTETTGLQSVPLFLCGVMTYGEGEFRVEQMLARDYTEEPALLRHIHEALTRAQVLVTYNGRTFDLPFIHDRMVYHLMDGRIETAHLDLLPHARRRFGKALPDCKLQTVERELCQRSRSLADIPGEEIPQTYHDFVASGDARLLQPICEHNALDLLTLADLLVRLTEA